MMFGCSVAGRLQRQQMTASLSQLTRAERQERQQDYRPQARRCGGYHGARTLET